MGVFAQAKTPAVRLYMQNYWHPTTGTYAELILFNDPSSLTFIPTENGFVSALDVTVDFYLLDSLAESKQFGIFSPVMVDTTNSFEMVHLERIPIPSGEYSLKISVKNRFDIHSEPVEMSQFVVIEAPEALTVSKLQLTIPFAPNDDWVRYGVPTYYYSLGGFAYFSEADTLLQFYSELYQPVDSQKVGVIFNIYDVNSNRPIRGMRSTKRLEATPFTPLVARMDLRELPTGNYFAKIQVVNSQGKTLARDSVLFGRQNSRVDFVEDLIELNQSQLSFLGSQYSKEELTTMIDCLYPIAAGQEQSRASVLMQSQDSIQMYRYLASFWTRRQPTNPSQAFAEYMEKVHEVDEKYGSSFRPGYSTDRGRVWLQYGKPDNIEMSNFDNSTYPYEIWQYNHLTSANRSAQVNRVFIFVNRDVAGRNFRLVHSNAIGELSNPRWKYQINRNGTVPTADETSSGTNSDPFGTRLNNNSIINGSTSSGYERR